MEFETSRTLKSRSFIALVLSQFLAAFNDQAVHIAAIFYGSDMLVRYAGVGGVDEKLVISLVTGCFISPFFFFSPLAGLLADKYSKRSIVVLWKVVEVAIMALCLVGFLLPHLGSLGDVDPRMLAQWSAGLVIATVFMMGTHSAFFVPAKYGVMPEILHPSVLSRGNGMLEGTSFVAQILGTSFGGILYLNLKSKVGIVNGVRTLDPGREWIIGGVLLALAIIGAIASFFMRPMPAATPDRPLTWKPWVPLRRNLGSLGHSRSLLLAVVGIAFFSFMTLFLRQTLIFQGETNKELEIAAASAASSPRTPSPIAASSTAPTDLAGAGAATDAPLDAVPGADASSTQIAELWITILIALVGLGVGLGCSLAGYLSGNRIELGLVPIGAFFMVVLTAALAGTISSRSLTIACLILIGLAAGQYIVPLYTLLQHRAPKDSKGNLVATSNFLNVAGGLIAVAVFYFLTFLIQRVMGLNLDWQEVVDNPSLRGEYDRQMAVAVRIPQVLFLAASIITALMLLLLCRQRPDFIVRAASLLRNLGRRHLQAAGLSRVPGTGPVVLATNGHDLIKLMQMVSVIDRFTRILAPQLPPANGEGRLGYFARKTGILTAGDGRSQAADWDRLMAVGRNALDQGNVVGLLLHQNAPTESDRLLAALQKHRATSILPVYCGEMEPEPGKTAGIPTTRVVVGDLLPSDATSDQIRQAIEALATANIVDDHGH